MNRYFRETGKHQLGKNIHSSWGMTTSTSIVPREGEPNAAKVSDSGTVSNVRKLLGDLRAKLALHTKVGWEIGDLLVLLIDRHKMTLSEVSEECNRYSISRFSELYSTALAFPKEERGKHPFSWYEIARNAENRRAREGAKFATEYPEVAKKTPGLGQRDYSKALQTIVTKAAEDNASPDKREATKVLVQAMRETVNPFFAVPELPDISAQCFNQPNDEVLTTLAKGSVKLLHCDPPYANYTRLPNGTLDHSTSAGVTGSDNDDSESACRATCLAIETGAPTLARGGVIILWQSSLGALRREILDSIEKSGLTIATLVTWDKGRPQAGNFAGPYSICSEVYYVICRAQEAKEIIWHEEQRHRNVINDIAPVRFDASQMEQTHWWAKPAAMCELIVRLHSMPGDLVVDAFGCTGSMSLAAAKLGRKWLYIESHKRNYAAGVENIKTAIAQTDAKIQTEVSQEQMKAA